MWQDFDITENDIEDFKELIPEHLVKPLKDGTVFGIVVINSDSGANPVVGIVLYSLTRGYVEIEWVARTKAYDLPDHGADMVRILTNRARLCGLRGVFATFNEDEEMGRYFPEYEYTRIEEDRRVYRFCLKDVKEIDIAEHKERLEKCVPLKKASEELKNAVFTCAEKEGQILPLFDPVDWNSFEPEASAIYSKDGKEAEGIVLISLNGEELVISLLYSANPAVTVALLEHALKTAIRKYGEDMEVACPVLTKVSEQLLRSMVKGARSEKHIRAQVVFPVGTGTLKDFEVYGF